MIKVRKAEVKDIKDIAAIESKCFAHPWKEEDIKESMLGQTLFLIAEEDSEAAGYCGMQKALSDGYITNVAVKKEKRTKGVGTRLLAKLESFALEEGFDSISLEVRCSNTAAINLYKKMGYTALGLRKNFYRDPREDAVIMTLFLKKEGK